MFNPLKFHWALPIEAAKKNEAQADRSGGIDLEALVEFVSCADKLQIESLLTPFGFHMPDPIALLGRLSAHTERVGFMLAYRAGLMSPTLFVQQVNTLSHLFNGRISLNIICGYSPVEQGYYGDFLSHDERFERAGEYLDICSALWNATNPVSYAGKHYQLQDAQLNTKFTSLRSEVRQPKIYLSGNSKIANHTASQHAQCWLRYGDTPEKIVASHSSIAQTEYKPRIPIGLRMSVIVRQTREESIEAAFRVVENPDLKWKEFIKTVVDKSDSVAVKSTYELAEKANSEWLGPNLWSGAVPYRGGPALALVGNYDEVANEIMRYKFAGVSEFILSGWPTLAEMQGFCDNVLPRVRAMEQLESSIEVQEYAV
ncbi:LLM class flavin-dependent oxidoreductase [Nostoc sp. CENA67]|uniref:LLM class flavin-dependent oxidoreductase n=1 Tax=Amazonocrinis nigriterrae CENA67 TaxID=2794033 RepID=A0A8J7L7M4_9NOST|nr:LLM class flavin-dependent oxidoreductase [Amazonocrinis nigriterrae]MBH8563569.1 LLM class flavin-dependent oxidoreductase [Amazonocrinis nigriterrae CENA67]